MDDAEQLITNLLAPRTPQERKERRVTAVREAMQVAMRVTEPNSEERKLLLIVLYRALKHEEGI